jgi:hypothetical protein
MYMNDLILFLHLCDILPFEKNPTLYLHKLEFPLFKDDLYQVWLILASWFWRIIFLFNFIVFSLFCYYLPLEKSFLGHTQRSLSLYIF